MNDILVHFKPWVNSKYFPDTRMGWVGILGVTAANSIKVIATTLSLMGVVYDSSNDSVLKANTETGVDIFLYSVVLGMLINGFLTSIPHGVVAPDRPAALVLFTIAIRIGKEVPDVDRRLQTFWMICALSSVGVGLVLVLASLFRMSRIFLMIPYQLVCAFLGIIGAFSIRSAIMLATSEVWTYFWPDDFKLFFTDRNMSQLACAIVTFIGIRRMPEIKKFLVSKCGMPAAAKPLILPLYFCIVPLIFWLIVNFTPFNHTRLTELNWTFGKADITTDSFRWWELIDIADIDWTFINSQTERICILIAGTVLSAVLNCSAIEAGIFPRQIDADSEMLNLGVINLCTGLTFGVPLTHVIGASITAGGDTKHRVSCHTIFLVLFVLWMSSGSATLRTTLPKFFLAGVTMNTGYKLFDLFGIKSRAQLQTWEWYTVVFCIFIAFIVGLQPAMLIALGLTSIGFLVQISNGMIINSIWTGVQRKARVMRTEEEKKVLAEHAKEIVGYTVAGVLFFASAQKLVESLELTLGTIVHHSENKVNDEGSSTPLKGAKIKYVIIDFTDVLQMDSTAAKHIVKMKNVLEGQGRIVLFAGFTENQVARLIRAGLEIREPDNPATRGKKRTHKKDLGALVLDARPTIAGSNPLNSDLGDVSDIEEGDSNQQGVEMTGVRNDATITGIFGDGLAGNNRVPFLSTTCRALEHVESDILYRHLYEGKNSIHVDKPFGDGVLTVAQMNTVYTLGNAPIPKDLQCSLSCTQQRMAGYGMSDEEFFERIAIKLPKEIAKYVEKRTYGFGDHMFFPGEQYDFFYICRQGIFEVREPQKSSHRVGVRLTKKGFGGMNLVAPFFERMPNGLEHVSVSKDTVMWLITRDAITRLEKECGVDVLNVLTRAMALSQARDRNIIMQLINASPAVIENEALANIVDDPGEHEPDEDEFFAGPDRSTEVFLADDYSMQDEVE